MSLPVIAVITSAQCGHCVTMRGQNGQPKEPNKNKQGEPLSMGPIPKGHHWSPSFFEKLITGGKNDGVPRFRVFEFHFSKLQSPNMESIAEISDFALDKQGKMNRLTYSPSPKGVYVDLNGKGKKQNNQVTWQDFVKKFPSELVNFIIMYPMWIVSDGKIWDEAVRGNSHLYLNPIGASVVKNGKEWRSNGYSGNQPDILDFVSKLDLSSLQPPNDDEEKKADGDVDGDKKKFSGSCERVGYRIVSE